MFYNDDNNIKCISNFKVEYKSYSINIYKRRLTNWNELKK
jgi:hypothetical protein